jgi:hypothetical protein
VETCDEVKARRGDGQNSAACGVLFCVTAGEGIRHRVEGPGLVFNGEIIAEKLADPMMLRNRGKALIKQKLEAVVVCPHRETSAPKIWPPMPNGVHKADELALVCREGVMTWCHRPAEVGDGVLVLDQYRSKTVCRCIALDDERPCEIWQRQNQRGCNRGLEGLKSRRRLVVLGEAILLEQRR